jgi:hypothetical protein
LRPAPYSRTVLPRVSPARRDSQSTGWSFLPATTTPDCLQKLSAGTAILCQTRHHITGRRHHHAILQTVSRVTCSRCRSVVFFRGQRRRSRSVKGGKSTEHETRSPTPCGPTIYRFRFPEQSATDGSLEEPSRQIEVSCTASPEPFSRWVVKRVFRANCTGPRLSATTFATVRTAVLTGSTTAGATSDAWGRCLRYGTILLRRHLHLGLLTRQRRRRRLCSGPHERSGSQNSHLQNHRSPRMASRRGLQAYNQSSVSWMYVSRHCLI